MVNFDNSALLRLLVVTLLYNLRQVSAIDCFVPNTSLLRREAILIVPGDSELACQAICVNDVKCTAIQITSTGNCVIFGAEISATFGQCPVPFTCLLRTNTGCVPKWRRPIDMGYIRHYCTGKIEAPPMDDGTTRPCGTHVPGNRTIFIDALMHDGTNAVFENSNGGRMAWDDGIGSWYMTFDSDTVRRYKHYFVGAKCVRPQTPTPAECECDALPLSAPACSMPGKPPFTNPKPLTNLGRKPVCSTTHVQVQTVNVYDDTTKRQINAYDTTVNRFIYCANKAYIAQTDWVGNDNAYIVVAASCVS